VFSRQVERALHLVIDAHDGQVRKGDARSPYVVHPLHVAMMLSRWGMDEDVIVAGLLHDVVEDCEDWTVERVEAEFGAHIATIVDELTEDKSQTWEQRKQAGIDGVDGMSPQAATVKAADKLHNLESLLAELRAAADPANVWKNFKGGRSGTLRVAGEMVEALRRRVDPRLGRALALALKDVVETDAQTESGANPTPVRR